MTSFHGYTSGDNTSGCSTGMQRREGYRRVRRGTIRYVGNSFTAGSQVDGSQRYALSNKAMPNSNPSLGMLPKYRLSRGIPTPHRKCLQRLRRSPAFLRILRDIIPFGQSGHAATHTQDTPGRDEGIVTPWRFNAGPHDVRAMRWRSPY